jgi:hypothetical protein
MCPGGDFLEAKIVKDGVLLKPVAMIERKRAWEHRLCRVRPLARLHQGP